MKLVFLILLIDLIIGDDDLLLEDYKNSIKKRIRNNSGVCSNEINFLVLREIDDSDDPSNFLNNRYTTYIEDFPKYGVVNKKPWSGHYWPIKFGSISARYSNNINNSIKEYDEGSESSGREFTWEESVNKYHQPQEHNNLYNTEYFQNYVYDNYSPSEKYDLLVGDYDYTLTNALKAEGNYMVRDKNGDIPDWMGICHGWTPASIYQKEPIHSVSLTASDGKTRIVFLPDDIKALVSLFWAEAKYTTKFIGNECKYKNHKNIPSDPNTGLWIEESCFSINPGAFLITIANQIGIKGANLIFDPDTTGEIWNQPVYKYSFEYFNILNNRVGNLHQSIQDINNLKDSNDKIVDFIYRKSSRNTRYVLGIEMTVDYIVEVDPVHEEKVSEDYNKEKENKKYTFSIELDESLNVIGGEWLSNQHPIFIWDVNQPNIVRGIYDDLVFNGNWQELNKLTGYAKDASRRLKVLKSIVEYLLENSI